MTSGFGWSRANPNMNPLPPIAIQFCSAFFENASQQLFGRPLKSLGEKHRRKLADHIRALALLPPARCLPRSKSSLPPQPSLASVTHEPTIVLNIPVHRRISVVTSDSPQQPDPSPALLQAAKLFGLTLDEIHAAATTLLSEHSRPP